MSSNKLKKQTLDYSMADILKDKKFTKAVLELQKLLERYGIQPEDWALPLHVSFLVFGYDMNYNRKNHLHIVLNYEKTPWHLSVRDKRIFEVTPPLKSKFFKEYHQYIAKTGFDFDILVFSPTICRKLFKDCVNFKLKNGKTAQIMSPLSNVEMESKYWKLFLDNAPQKLERIIRYYRQILKQAIEKKDKALFSALSKLMGKYEKPLEKKLGQKLIIKRKEGVIFGQIGNRGKVRGRICVIKDIDNPRCSHSFDIIVARITSPKLVPLLMRAKGLVTDEGGRLCHAAIISRELKIPCVIGTKIATQVLKDGDIVEVDALKGQVNSLS